MHGNIIPACIIVNPVPIKRVKELPLDEQRRHLHLYHWSSYRAYSGRAKRTDWLEPGPIPARLVLYRYARYRIRGQIRGQKVGIGGNSVGKWAYEDGSKSLVNTI